MGIITVCFAASRFSRETRTLDTCWDTWESWWDIYSCHMKCSFFSITWKWSSSTKNLYMYSAHEHVLTEKWDDANDICKWNEIYFIIFVFVRHISCTVKPVYSDFHLELQNSHYRQRGSLYSRSSMSIKNFNTCIFH